VGSRGQQDKFAKLWREGRLVVEDPNTLDVINNKTSFRELLMAYTNRMKKVRPDPPTPGLSANLLMATCCPCQTDEDPIQKQDILSFLRREYGERNTTEAMFREDRPALETMRSLKTLLEWFRMRFPYYKSACLHCGNHEHNHMIGEGLTGLNPPL
jgi:hypothetical protein